MKSIPSWLWLGALMLACGAIYLRGRLDGSPSVYVATSDKLETLTECEDIAKIRAECKVRDGVWRTTYHPLEVYFHAGCIFGGGF